MTIDTDRVYEACKDLWQVVLGLNLAEASGEVPAAPAEPEEDALLASCVQFSGDWQGALVVECDPSVTRHAAAMLFHDDPEGLTDGDLQDALNELTRIVGKNLQKAIDSTGKVSSPKPVVGGQVPAALQTMQETGSKNLDCEGRPVRIRIRETIASTAAVG